MPWENSTRLLAYLAAAVVIAGLWIWYRRTRHKADARTDFEKLIGKPAPAPLKPARLTKECRWSKDTFRNDPKLARWDCAACGAETYIDIARKPGQCLRQDTRLRDRDLTR
jgi:hypothetical protein